MSTPTRIELTKRDRERLEHLIRAGKASARQLTRARILLLSDTSRPGQWKSAPAVARALLVHPNTVRNVRRRFVREGLDAALRERPRAGAPPKLTGEIEAQLTALACGPAPAGRARWTLQLLADRLVELRLLERVDPSTVRVWLKKTHSSPGA